MSTLTITALQSSLYWLDKDANLAMFNKQLEAITHHVYEPAPLTTSVLYRFQALHNLN